MQKRLSITLAAVAFLLFTASSALASRADDIIKIKRDVLVSKDMSVNDLIVLGGSATVYGTVEGSAVIAGGSLYLKDGGRVRGQAIILGGELVMSPDSRVDGKVTQIHFPRFLPSLAAVLLGGWFVGWAVFGAMVLLGLVGLAVLLIALIPGHIGSAAASMENSFAVAFLRGVFWTIMIAPIAILLAISVIGIILIPLELFMVAVAFLVGYIVSAVYIGKKVAITFNKSSSPLVYAIIGMVVLYAIGFIPAIGLLIKAIFMIAGFGAVVATRFGTIKKAVTASL